MASLLTEHVSNSVAAGQSNASESEPGEQQAASAFQNLAQMFEAATETTHMDHPMCPKCLDRAITELQEQAASAEQLTLAYEDALAALQVCHFRQKHGVQPLPACVPLRFSAYSASTAEMPTRCPTAPATRLCSSCKRCLSDASGQVLM